MNPYLVATLRAFAAGAGASGLTLVAAKDWKEPTAAFIGGFTASFLAHFGGSGPMVSLTRAMQIRRDARHAKK